MSPTALIVLLGVVVLGWARRRTSRAARVPDPRRELASFAAHLARSCRGGLTVGKAASMAAPTLSGAVGEAVHDLVGGLERGLSLDAAMHRWADTVKATGGGRGDSDPGDVELLVCAVRFAEVHGAGLPDAFDSVAVALMDRCELEQEVTALTSQAHASVWVLCALPIVGVLMISVLSTEVFAGLFTSAAGLGLLTAAVVLDALAVLVSSRLTRMVLR